MKRFAYLGGKVERFCCLSTTTAGCFLKSCRSLIHSSLLFLVFHVNPVWIHLSYFVTLSIAGYLALKESKPIKDSLRPRNLDTFFTSVSAATVSSMSTVEMEVFSNTQLIILTTLMLLGGEVFNSVLDIGLQLARFKFYERQNNKNNDYDNNKNTFIEDHIELGLAKLPGLENQKPITVVLESTTDPTTNFLVSESEKSSSVKCLGYVVLNYMLLVHVVGSSLVATYISMTPSARKVLTQKNLHMETFSVFLTVSTFSNCGFVPTNENMMVFKKNSGLLLLLIPQVLLGNTLCAPFLRFLIWVLEKITNRAEFRYILTNTEEMGYSHLLSGPHCCLVVVTVLGSILVQLVLFCSMEWNSEAMGGLSSYQKLVGSLFQAVNSRHAGESVFDLSIISSAVLVLFVVSMYLPPYASIWPVKQREGGPRTGKESKIQKRTLMDCMSFSQLFYLVIFIILICITEREKMKRDPLNFNALNITLEVISAYGNVGLTTGYSCKRQLEPDISCKDAWYGFVGRWSNKGKLILIIVMFFGRLKKFFARGGKARKPSDMDIRIHPFSPLRFLFWVIN